MSITDFFYCKHYFAIKTNHRIITKCGLGMNQCLGRYCKHFEVTEDKNE